MTIDYIHAQYPGVPVILDAKRGDIGSTATMYAKEAFERYRADAVTVNPYMGVDSVSPFLEYADKGVIVLCKTSNPGAGDVQDIPTGNGRTYERVADLATRWNTRGNVLLVMGATFPEQLRRVRSIASDMPFLVPGIGIQGGDIEATVRNGQDSQGVGLIISSSRSILYASSGADFAERARDEARRLKETINLFRGRAVNG
jgi:orotidine-5'-phosphate decarboxylase